MAINNTPLETEEHIKIIEYCKLKNIRVAHVNNEMYSKSWKQKRLAKLKGTSPGFPDLVIIHKNKLLFVEVKRKKGGQTSKAQKEWLQALANTESAVVAVVKSFEEFVKLIEGL